METRKCKQCQCEFEVRTEGHTFCSNNCRSKYHNSKKNKRRVTLSSNRKLKKGDYVLGSDLTTQLISTLDRIKNLLESESAKKDEYLIPKQVCQLLSFNRSTFERYVENGIFKLYRLGKGKVYVKRSEIDDLFQN